MMEGLSNQVYVCERCGVYYDGQLNRLDPQPKQGEKRFDGSDEKPWPVPFDCGCPREIAKAVGAPAARKAIAQEQHRTGGIDRSCPPEREMDLTPDHAAQVRGFVASGEAGRRDREVYDMLAKGFDGMAPGAWIASQVFRQELGIEAVHSCASRIRDWSVMRGFDVDSRVARTVRGKQYWEYRICLEKDSMRMERERKRCTQRSTSTTANEAHAVSSDLPL